MPAAAERGGLPDHLAVLGKAAGSITAALRESRKGKKRMFGAGRLGHGQFILSAQIFSRLHCFVSFSSNTLQSHRGAPGLGALQPGFGSSVSSCLELLWLNY